MLPGATSICLSASPEVSHDPLRQRLGGVGALLLGGGHVAGVPVLPGLVVLFLLVLLPVAVLPQGGVSAVSLRAGEEDAQR